MSDQVKAIQEDINKQIDIAKIEDLLKNNVFEFEHNDCKYRLRKPTFKERQQLYLYRSQRYTSLLNDEQYLLEADLKKSYKKRGIDIDAMQSEILDLEHKKKTALTKLGELLQQKAPDEELALFKKEIEDLSDRQRQVAIEKQVLLEFSIENQTMLSVYYYAVHLVADKYVNDQWVRVFPTYADLEQHEDEKLFAEFVARIPLLFRHELEM